MNQIDKVDKVIDLYMMKLSSDKPMENIELYENIMTLYLMILRDDLLSIMENN
jgi:hypothetical protein